MHYAKRSVFFITYFGLIFILPFTLCSQTNPNFDFSLGVDYSAAEQMLDYFDHLTGNTKHVAELRGNQLAAATSVMLARTEKADDDFRQQLELARNNARFESDVYGFLPAKNHIQELRKLLLEVKHRQLDRRIVATIAAFFPEQAKISTRFSVYFVVIGNERAAAFMRHVVWNYDVPTFVGEDEGEPIIVVNLARIIEGPTNVEAQFIEVLSTTAHECFHAAFSVLKKSLPESVKARNVAELLLEVVQNEGVAYYLSQQTHIGDGTLSRRWFDGTAQAVEALNSVLLEMSSPNLTRSRAQELMMNANLSGSFESNYGATAGMRMAYEIDKRFGRPALTATLMGGSRSFISTYMQACLRDGTLPKIDKQVLFLLRQ
ncbi:MAG: hypothetical protein NTX44_06115 [Ignavibacteriales bacterium]|nr:hypothetical protein [Ignavibacteriales bacterium]